MSQDEEAFTIAAADGAELVLRRLGNPGRPRLLLSHGNGFAIDGYRSFWEPLAADYELILFDLRNHGRNALGPIEHHSIAAMARDHLAIRAAVNEAFGERFTVGLFHSVSAIAAIKASAEHRAQWDALILVDPPLIAPVGHPLRAKGQSTDKFLAMLARRRPARYDRLEDLAEQYRGQIGEDWVAGAEMDMAGAVTRVDPAGGLGLTCPPEYEARIYLDNALFDSFEALSSLRQPTLIISADPNRRRALPPAFVGPEAAAAHGLPHFTVPETGHLLQIERPAIVADRVRTFLAAQIGSSGV